MNPKKILIIQTAFLGDAILTLPMIQILKEKYNKSIVDIVCIPSSKDIFYNSPSVDNVIVYDKRETDKSLINFYRLIKKIRNNKYELIYSPHRSFRTSLMVLFSGVNETYGFNIASISFVYKNRVKYNAKIHEVARNLELIGVDTSVENWKIPPILRTVGGIEDKLRKLIPERREKIIAIAPGSVWNTKIYPKEYYELLIAKLISDGFYIILIGGNDDRELCESIIIKFDKNIESFAGKLNPYETVLLLKNVRLLICNDSAPTHMGMAACIPVLTIYCSTVPGFGFYPYNNKSTFISYNKLKCKPCGIHGKKRCPISTFECAHKLTPNFVIEKVNEILVKGKN